MAATLSTGSKAHAKPSNVQQIVKRAQQIDYKPLVPLKYWLRSARTLLKEVRKMIWSLPPHGMQLLIPLSF